MSVGIVVVSHSAAVASGVVELAAQMAPDVRFEAAGGTDKGGIGTSFELISAAIGALSDLEGIVVLCDLGSAYLTTDTALDFLDDDVRALVAVSPAPLVEGAVAAAVAAQTGADRNGVLAAALSAFDHETSDSLGSDQATPGDDDGVRSGAETGFGAVAGTDNAHSRVEVELVNESGLHARPAAEFVKAASRFNARVTVNGTDAKSLLSIMAMALGRGSTLTIEAEGADADHATAELAALVRSGFGEH